MHKLWQKIRYFFIAKPRFSKLTVVVSALFIAGGLFAVSAQPADAGIVGAIGTAFGHLFLWIAGLLGKILVIVIDMLIGVAQYNDFINAPAVNTGWAIVRDLCNMFFVIILLLIAFGTILKIESYKYTRLLGKLVIMAVLINFSKPIAGFLIDLGQVVMMTFVNAFADTAAGNFAEAYKLREMLDINFDKVEAGGSSDFEKFAAPLFACILLVVAIMTTLAMVMVFLVRIITLWILIVLSPLSYLLSASPVAGQYAKEWWTRFGKWVAIGPVLAFFIWLALAVVTNKTATELNITSGGQGTYEQGLNFQGSTLSATITNVSSSENVLGFTIGVAMFIIALTVAQTLGGAAGNAAGKMFGMLKTMGSKPLNLATKAQLLPLKGAWEGTKALGRKARRTVRDSKVGTALNFRAMYRGAKQRGEEVEQLSVDRATARGRQIWDRRPEYLGGGGDVTPAEQLVEARFERGVASEASTLQKEQKSALLEQVWDKGGKDAEITRRALLASLASEGHIDDALATDFFHNKAKWVDENGQERTGFKKEDGSMSSAEINSAFMRAAVSRGGNRDVTKINQGSMRTLYDIEEAGKRIQHYEYAGEVGVDERTGELRLHSKGEKDSVVAAEIDKQTDRKYISSHPHNFSRIVMDNQGNQMRVVDPNDAAEFRNFQRLSSYAEANPDDFARFSTTRITQLLGKFDNNDDSFEIYNHPEFLKSIQELYQNNGSLVDIMERKAGAEGYKMTMDDGSVKQFANLHEFAEQMGWQQSDTYGTADFKGQKGQLANRTHPAQQQPSAPPQPSKAEQKAQAAQEKADDLQTEADEKRAEATKLEQEAESEGGLGSKPRKQAEAGKLRKEADELEKKAQQTASKGHVQAARDTANEFDKDAGTDEGTREIQAHFTDNDITRIADGIKQAMSEVDLAGAEGLSPDDFAKAIQGPIDKLKQGLEKLPDNIKKSLPQQLDSIQRASGEGKFYDQMRQKAMVGALQRISDTIGRKQKKSGGSASGGSAAGGTNQNPNP